MARLKGSRMSGKNRIKKGVIPDGTKKGRSEISKRQTGVLEMETEESETETLLSINAVSDFDNASVDEEDELASLFVVSKTQKKALGFFLTLAILVGWFLLRVDETVLEETQGVDGEHALVDHVVIKKPKPFHSGDSFGGVNNIAHPGGAKAASKGEGIVHEEIIIPKSNVGHAIPSLNRPNIVNSWGHYVHDEHRSPYASHLYNATKEELEERQEKYLLKMAKVREEWGAWDFRDPLDDFASEDTITRSTDDPYRPTADFSKAQYKDLPTDDFPFQSWQEDEMYVARFIEEGKKLIDRVKEGIYAENGWGSKGKDEKFLEERDKIWKIHLWDPAECGTPEQSPVCVRKGRYPDGIAYIQKVGFDALVQKLLHAMMTNDEFYVVLAGHSAAAGHGNDFQQNRIITFHHMMEPVFDKLGVKLVSRNMGMGGVGTLQFSLGGGDLYGEADFLEWDSAMTEKGPPVDLFNKQAILSGERVPFLMVPLDQQYNIVAESNGTAFIGDWVRDIEKIIFPQTTYENFETQPYAARWFNEKEEKYNAVCWEPRVDFTPLKTQKHSPDSQVGWHPGNRHHQWSGRKVALVLLEALEVAFERWEEGISKEGCPLASSYWHVGESYKNVRELLRTHINKPKEGEKEGDVRSKCEELFTWMPRMCRVQMHGFGMWNPRAHIDYDFLNIIHPAPNGYKPDFLEDNVYDGFDLMPLNQAVPDGEIDVHAIAIATTNAAPDLDHSWIEDEVESGNLTSLDGVVNETDVPPTMRWLREASKVAFRKGAEEFPPSTVVKGRKLVPETKKEKTVRSSTSPSNNIHMLRRLLENADDKNAAETSDTKDAVDEIVPGRGWMIHGWSPVRGYCDGSANSECARGEVSQCMILGANDMHYDVYGNTLSGWLVFTVPKVREGIIMLRIEWWCGADSVKDGTPVTKGWTEVNDGMTHDTTPWNATAKRALAEMMTTDYVDFYAEEEQHRDLKMDRKLQIPADLEMDIAIDGVITKTMEKEEWELYSKERAKNVAVWPILNDISMAERDWEGKSVEVAIRFRSKINPNVAYCISHVYYA